MPLPELCRSTVEPDSSEKPGPSEKPDSSKKPDPSLTPGSQQRLLMMALVGPVMLLLLVLFLSWRSIETLERDADRLYQQQLVPLQTLSQLAKSYNTLVIGTLNRANAGLLGRQQARQRLDLAQRQITLDSQKLSMQPQYQALLLQIEQTRPVVRELVRVISQQQGELKTGSLKGQLSAWEGLLYDRIDPLRQQLEQRSAQQRQQAEQQFILARQHYQQQVRELTLVGGIALLLCLVPGLWLRKRWRGNRAE
ncbi:MAG: hypothetical protein OIF57_14750 [Marinobacterium sp.]|nr:hypothetical protein [Marinobacterium sp.]